MKSNKAGALALTIILALALACLAPCAALADGGPLAAGAAEVSAQALPAEAHVAYAANAGGKWAWKQDGATSSVAKGRQVARLRVRVSSTLPGSVQYQAYVSGEGWQAARADGAAAGKKSKRVEAVRIALTGELSARYDVLYRVKTSKGKWQAWRANGQAAGKAGAKVRAVQVALAPKGAAGAASPGIVSARYRAKPQGSSWQPWKSDGAKAGKSGRRLSALAASVDAGDLGGGVRYRALLSSGRWTGWKADGRKLSTKKRIVAVQVELYGGVASRYDVAYATGNKKSGWSPYSRNGATSQPAKGKQIETIRIRLEDKLNRNGWFAEGGSWHYYEGGSLVKNRWISTSESPANGFTSRPMLYWIDSAGNLAVNRFIDPRSKNDAAAGKAAYATASGYILMNGKAKTSEGFVFADGSGALNNSSGWLTTSAYDGSSQTYYLKNVGSYSVARTGLFKVNGKQYYGYPDEGYIARDISIYVSGRWYSASPSGVLGAATSTDRMVERYVQWAISIANDNRHGYSQAVRWGPDYDCSSLVISALQNAGLDTGAAVYTGNMKSELTARGFRWHTNMPKIRRGDILLVHNSNRQHTEIYLGNGRTVGAHGSETGGIYGVAGDQTGNEISVGPYYSIWQGYLRLGS